MSVGNKLKLAKDVVGEQNLKTAFEAIWAHPEDSARYEDLEDFADGLCIMDEILDQAEELGYVEKLSGVNSNGKFVRYRLTDEGREAFDELANHLVNEETRETTMRTFLNKDRYDPKTEAAVANYLAE
jgi:DNA-binding MarR family transcriptional regulator